MASISNKVLVIIAAVFALIGWAVALGGIAALNDTCNKQVDEANSGYGSGRYSHKDCSDQYRYQWWGIWFTFFLTVIILLLEIFGKADAWSVTLQVCIAKCNLAAMRDHEPIRRKKLNIRILFAQVFCAACLSVTMIDVNAMYDAVTDAAEAALAGFIIMSMALMLLIIFLGMGSAGVNVSISVGATKTSPSPAASQPAKGVDNA
ncbi:hypothetical protein VOLCADRAFT_106219 [Volvox carteri f. nagariensis]|uniref:Uncharacterized protein n=1 Tax=Volvox carteri f. nagariensis TaxID=3068 RepID=D8U5W5_VOLCA|nr:uncharacterized protein VOLCADRAFT_106219 [Volvox carteri f. nagariensis]EFJ44758.1 hypothetical protein VOLCADRAFT_106219 [Volvox carteri f. nagariensis]|eukprot:XP_002954041.1 hypothetical protein VOLCADRAFT_106219 [Volvox carteri f. nagariensis]